MRFCLFAFLIVALAACGKSPTSVVKKTYIDDNETMTVSQLLDNRDMCEKYSWEEFQDSNKRDIVQYSCIFADSQDFLALEREKEVEKAENYIRYRLKHAEESKDLPARKIKELLENKDFLIEEYMKSQGWGEFDSDDEKLKYLENDIADRISDLENSIVNVDLKILEINQEFSTVMDRAHKMYPVYDNVTEVFQWVVNSENTVTPIYGEVYANSESGKKVLKKHRDFSGSFISIYEFREDDYKSYINVINQMDYMQFLNN